MRKRKNRSFENMVDQFFNLSLVVQPSFISLIAWSVTALLSSKCLWLDTVQRINHYEYVVNNMEAKGEREPRADDTWDILIETTQYQSYQCSCPLTSTSTRRPPRGSPCEPFKHESKGEREPHARLTPGTSSSSLISVRVP
jgi:hypothetical protein